MKKTKRFFSVLVMIALLCTYALPASAGTSSEPTLTVTSNVKQIDVGEGNADVVYTIKINPNGNKIAAFQFQLQAPEGMSLTTTKLPVAPTNQGGDGYWLAAKDLKFAEDENTGESTGIFESFDYTAETGKFNASGGIEGRTLDEEKIVMTIKATVDITSTKAYGLNVTQFKCFGVNAVNQGGATPIVDQVKIVPAPIAAVSATVADPQKGQELATSVTVGAETYTGAVVWYKGDTTEGGSATGAAEANQVYTAQITLTPKTADGERFADTVAVTGSYSGNVKPNEEGNLVFVKTFDATEDRTLQALEITNANISGTKKHGDSIEKSELTVKATYDTGESNLAYEDYEIIYSHGSTLSKGDTSFKVRKGNVESADYTISAVSGLALTADQFTFTAPELTYNGKTQIEVIKAAATAVEGVGTTTYSVKKGGTSVTEAVDAGEYTLFVSTADGTIYNVGTEIELGTVEIGAKPLTDGMIRLGTQETYDGSEKGVVITSVQDGETALTKDTDYSITSGDKATSVSSTTLVINGKGNYKGTASAAWTLSKATPIEGNFDIPTLDSEGVDYTGDSKTVNKPIVKSGIVGMGAVQVMYDDSEEAPTNAGSYNVTFNVEDGTNYQAKSGLTIGTLKINKVDYTGTKTATVFVRSGEATQNKTVELPALPAGATYAATGSVGQTAVLIDGAANVNERTLTFSTTSQNADTIATITIPVTGATNYNEYSVVVTVKAVDKETVEINGLTYADKEYDGTEVVPTGTLSVTDNKVATDELEIVFEKKNGETWESVSKEAMTTVGSYRVTYKVSLENENYIGEKAYEFAITPKVLTKPTLSGTYVYDGIVQTAALADFDAATMEKSGDTKKDAGSTNITVSLKDTTNYKWSDGVEAAIIEWSIAKANLKVKPKDISITKGAAKPTAIEVEYAGLKGTDKGTDVAVLASGDLTAFEIRNADDTAALADTNTAGTYKIKFTGTPVFSEATNYDIQIADGTLTISNPQSGGGSYYPYTPTTPSKPSAPGLDSAKKDSNAALSAAVAGNKYDAAEQAEVKKIMDKAAADIKNAKTEAEVKAIQEAAEKELDQILTTEEKEIIAAVESVEKGDFKTKSKAVKRNGKKVIKLTWNVPEDVQFDGFEIYRSTKKNSGYGTEPYFTTTKTSYTNTKNLKAGKTYYYKVRAFVVINGEKVYTEYSLKAWRKA